MNYTEIVDAAKTYADRHDVEVSDNIDIFIIMAESRMNRVLKTKQQTHRIYTTSIKDREHYTLPRDYNGMRSIQFNTGSVDGINSATILMEYVTPEKIAMMQQSEYSESKYYYTVTGNQIQVHPTLPDSGTIEIVFYRRVPNLSSKHQENWMSQDNPDIYLAGIICEIELFVKNYDVAKLWDEKMGRSIDELKISDEENTWASGPLTMRVES